MRFNRIFGLLLTLTVSGCGGGQPAAPAGGQAPKPDAPPPQAPSPQASSAQASSPPRAKAVHPFPDFGFLPPPAGPGKYTGPVFKLSQDYPKTKPGAQPPFMKTDFKADWQGYMSQVRDYCFEGNTDHPDLEDDFRAENNTVRRWYHMPFQHWGPSGREGVHGMTKEAEVKPQALAVSQTFDGQTYALGLYNDLAGYTIGQVWNADDPAAAFAGTSFPEGATVCKVLFVDVPPAQVPSLANPLQWNAYITTSYQTQTRHLAPVSLIQMDIMVRDSRSPTEWVMGTFQYNGQLKNAKLWNNLVPVGLMWGNDPTITDNAYTNPLPAKTRINPALKETVINATADLPPTHLGWNGRLNGPVDNPVSSCISCHMTAEYPEVSPLNPSFDPSLNSKPGDAVWMRWFTNLKGGTPFDATDPVDPARKPGSTDFSLQLAMTLQYFADWQLQDGEFAEDYAAKPVSFGTGQAPTHFVKRHAKPIVRDVPAPPAKP